MSLPIIIMTRNEGVFLKKCISSIVDSVKVDVEIYVVDNASNSDEHLSILNEIECLYDVKVIRNKKNLWVLGLSDTISTIKKTTQSNYFFLTDGDIDFSATNSELKHGCWLKYLVDNMDSNVSIGKLGISLNRDFLEKQPSLFNILEQEKTLYNKDKKIGELFVSSVDTTAAIYRWDWSVDESSKLYPDHMRYLRPELYSCRTPMKVSAEHLGWQNYLDNSTIDVNDKVRCFSFLGGSVKSEILKRCSYRVRILYHITFRPTYIFWKIRRVLFTLKYCIRKIISGFPGQYSGL